MRETAASLALAARSPTRRARPSSGTASRERDRRPTARGRRRRATQPTAPTSSRRAGARRGARRVDGAVGRGRGRDRDRACSPRRSSRCTASSTTRTSSAPTAMAAAFDRATKVAGAREVGARSRARARRSPASCCCPTAPATSASDHLAPLAAGPDVPAVGGHRDAEQARSIVSAGVLGPDPTAVGVPRQRSASTAFAITVEHAGGVVHVDADARSRRRSPSLIATRTRATADAVRRLRPHPVLRGALRLLRLRDVDRPRPPDRRLRRRVRHRPRRAGAPTGYPAATSVFFGGGTPSLLAGRSARADPRRDRARRRRRGHRRVQSRQRRRGQARGVPPRPASTG